MPEPRHHRAAEAERQRALRRDHADADRALLPDAVLGEQRLVVVDVLAGKRSVKSSRKSSSEPGPVLVHPARPAFVVDLRAWYCGIESGRSRYDPAGR
jgi:Trm5-related predicted tRNA methylase